MSFRHFDLHLCYGKLLEFFLQLLVRLQSGGFELNRLFRSNLVTSYSGEFFGILCGSESSLLNAVFLYCKHRKVRIYQKHQPYSRQGANFTSE